MTNAECQGSCIGDWAFFGHCVIGRTVLRRRYVSFSVCVSHRIGQSFSYENFPTVTTLVLSAFRGINRSSFNLGSSFCGRDGGRRQSFVGSVDSRTAGQGHVRGEKRRALELAFHSQGAQGSSAKRADACAAASGLWPIEQ